MRLTGREKSLTWSASTARTTGARVSVPSTTGEIVAMPSSSMPVAEKSMIVRQF